MFFAIGEEEKISRETRFSLLTGFYSAKEIMEFEAAV